MDYVSSMILEIIYDRFKEDLVYVENIKNELKKNNNKFDGLLYLSKLDSESKELFAKKIGVRLEEIECTLNVLKEL